MSVGFGQSFMFLSFSPTLSSLQAFFTHTLSNLFPPSASYFCSPLPLFCHPSSFPCKRAYFLLLRKGELAWSQTSLEDEGKYIILTKERKADVIVRVWLEDVAQRCHQRLESGGRNEGWKGQKSPGCKCNRNGVNEAHFRRTGGQTLGK